MAATSTAKISPPKEGARGKAQAAFHLPARGCVGDRRERFSRAAAGAGADDTLDKGEVVDEVELLLMRGPGVACTSTMQQHPDSPTRCVCQRI